MKKEVLREFDKDILSINIFLYVIYCAIGFFALNIGDVLLESENFIYLIFYCLGFFTLLSYFLNRVDGDYEFLFLGFIDVCIGTFIFANSYFYDFGFILQDALLIYSVANVLNKGYRFKQLVEKDDINYIFKLVSTILLVFIGVLGLSLLYKFETFGITIFGYYFIIFGFVNLLEPLTGILLRNEILNEKIRNRISRNNKKSKVESKPTLKNKIKVVKNKKPVVSIKNGEVKKSKKERRELNKLKNR